MGYSRVESDGSRMCHELLAIDEIDTLLEAAVHIGDWQIESSPYRGMITPTEFSSRLNASPMTPLGN